MNLKKIVPIAILVVVAGFGVYRLVRQYFTSEEARIRKLIHEVEVNFEGKKLSKCMAVVADDYSDNFGEYRNDSKADLEETLRNLFLVSRRISVHLEDIVIEIRGDEATIALTATAEATTTFGDMALHDEAGYTRYILSLRKEHGRWKVFRAEGVE
jgi:ketosteroid isomerase-like protein